MIKRKTIGLDPATWKRIAAIRFDMHIATQNKTVEFLIREGIKSYSKINHKP